MKFFACLLFTLCFCVVDASIYTERNCRYISSNCISDSELKYRFRIPHHPQETTKITPLKWGVFGVSLNGIPFDPSSAEFWNLDWRYESKSDKTNLGLNRQNAASKTLNRVENKMLLVGYAADGFPIYSEYGYSESDYLKSSLKKMQPSYRLKEGKRKSGPRSKYDGTFVQDYEYVEGLGDLDECNGRFGVTPEYPKGIYHYYLTDTFPYIPRFFKGTPDLSFLHSHRRRP